MVEDVELIRVTFTIAEAGLSWSATVNEELGMMGVTARGLGEAEAPFCDKSSLQASDVLGIWPLQTDLKWPGLAPDAASFTYWEKAKSEAGAIHSANLT